MKMKHHPKKDMLVRQRRGLRVMNNLHRGCTIMFRKNGLCSHRPFYRMPPTGKRKAKECPFLVFLHTYQTRLKDLSTIVQNFDGYRFTEVAWVVIGVTFALYLMSLPAPSHFSILSML